MITEYPSKTFNKPCFYTNLFQKYGGRVTKRFPSLFLLKYRRKIRQYFVGALSLSFFSFFSKYNVVFFGGLVYG